MNKPKSDVALQTEADVSDVALQTEMEVTDVALQTEIEVIEVALQTEMEVIETGVQTRAVGTTDTKTQTDGQTSDVKSSQTDHVTSVHQFIQTEDYDTGQTVLCNSTFHNSSDTYTTINEVAHPGPSFMDHTYDLVGGDNLSKA